jgi:uncharacterized protein (DUF1330 family)
MLNRIQPRAVIDLARRDVPGPADVINLITTSNFNRYRWYGLAVMPALMIAGGRVMWMGRHERSLSGEPQCEKLLVVRYPSHRRFLAMTLNPYYLAINTLREAGVSRFEASFTHASHTDDDLASRRWLIGVHFKSKEGQTLYRNGLEVVSEAVAGAADAKLVYATEVTASVGILDPPAPTDPNPLRYRQLALFAPAEGKEFGDTELDAVGDAVTAVCEDSCVQLYRREPRSAYRPSLRGERQSTEGGDPADVPEKVAAEA